MTKSEIKDKKIEDTLQDVTNHKAWIWIQRAWETCPTNLPLMEWYEKFREELLTMYSSQKVEVQE